MPDSDGDGIPDDLDDDDDNDGIPDAEDEDHPDYVSKEEVVSVEEVAVSEEQAPATDEQVSEDVVVESVEEPVAVEEPAVDEEASVAESVEEVPESVEEVVSEEVVAASVEAAVSDEMSAQVVPEVVVETVSEEKVLPVDASEKDTDGDGIPDHLDSDDDNDGIPDHLDTDDDGDGIPDHLDDDHESKQKEAVAQEHPEDDLLIVSLFPIFCLLSHFCEHSPQIFVQEYEVPKNLRNRDHIADLLHLDAASADMELVINNKAEIMLKELKKIYEGAIKPLEGLYKYRDLSNRHFGDPEIFSKPLVLFMGPWSGGKSTLINYLTGNEYTEFSLRTGAEPSPAYFNILMYGEKPEVLDGTQLAADWTFSGLQKFGQGLEDRLRGLKLPNKLLERVSEAVRLIQWP